MQRHLILQPIDSMAAGLVPHHDTVSRSSEADELTRALIPVLAEK
jgi:hypothetical protein